MWYRLSPFTLLITVLLFASFSSFVRPNAAAASQPSDHLSPNTAKGTQSEVSAIFIAQQPSSTPPSAATPTPTPSGKWGIARISHSSAGMLLSSFKLPTLDAWVNPNPDNGRFEIETKGVKTPTVRICKYSRFGVGAATHTLKLVDIDVIARIIDRQLDPQKIWREETFSAFGTPTCPETRTFPSLSTEEEAEGALPLESVVAQWVIKQIQGETTPTSQNSATPSIMLTPSVTPSPTFRPNNAIDPASRKGATVLIEDRYGLVTKYNLDIAPVLPPEWRSPLPDQARYFVQLEVIRVSLEICGRSDKLLEAVDRLRIDIQVTVFAASGGGRVAVDKRMFMGAIPDACTKSSRDKGNDRPIFGLPAAGDIEAWLLPLLRRLGP